MSIFDEAHTLKLVKDADGVPTGISDVKSGLADVAVATVVGLVDDNTVVTGYARPAQAVVAYYAGRNIERAIKGEGVSLKPWG